MKGSDSDLLYTSALGVLDSVGRNEFWASLALKYTKGLGMRSCKKLLKHFGSAFSAIQHVRQWKEAKVSSDKALSLTSNSWRVLAKKEWDEVRGCPGTILLWNDYRYPKLLKEISDPPVFLYCLGDISLLSNSCVAIVGTRKCSIDGIQKTRILSKDLSKSGITVVSGLAMGIDREAHLSAVEHTGSTVAVLGSGINIDYPRQNLDIRKKIVSKGLIISEYAPNVTPEPNFFPTRNRIISGISLGVLVVEAALHSGSLITARLALEQNRSVYALSNSKSSHFTQGCQDLIQQGAYAVSTVCDILNDLVIPLKGSLIQDKISIINKDSAAKIVNSKKYRAIQISSPVHSQSSKVMKCSSLELNELEQRILEFLEENPADIEDLCQRLHVTSDILTSTLIMLEVRGIVKRLPNTQYCVCA